jgi:hypothetical protein
MDKLVKTFLQSMAFLAVANILVNLFAIFGIFIPLDFTYIMFPISIIALIYFSIKKIRFVYWIIPILFFVVLGLNILLINIVGSEVYLESLKLGSTLAISLYVANVIVNTFYTIFSIHLLKQGKN